MLPVKYDLFLDSSQVQNDSLCVSTFNLAAAASSLIAVFDRNSLRTVTLGNACKTFYLAQDWFSAVLIWLHW